MLVRFHKGFTMEGETSYSTKKPFHKEVEERSKIYLHTGVRGICDETEVEKEVERLVAEELATSRGWGKNFSGWQRVVPYDELLKIAEERGWKDKDFSTGKITTEPVNQWKMKKTLEELTGEQFAQFCRENDVCLKGV